MFRILPQNIEPLNIEPQNVEQRQRHGMVLKNQLNIRPHGDWIFDFKLKCSLLQQNSQQKVPFECFLKLYNILNIYH